MQENISIILPCYNEWGKIYKNISFLQDYIAKKLPSINASFLLVNDWSQDNTKCELFKLKNHFLNITVISYNTNRWKGYALRQGLLKAKWDIIAFYDSDLDIAPKYLINHISHLLENRTSSIVIWRKKMWKCHISMKRKLISNINIQVNSVLFGLPVRDTQTGLKVFRRELRDVFIKNVKTHWYAFDVDFLYHVVMNGYSITSLPVVVKINEKWSWVNTSSILIFLKDLISLFKKSHRWFLQRKSITLKSKIRISLLKFVIFPIENILDMIFLIKKLKSKNETKI